MFETIITEPNDILELRKHRIIIPHVPHKLSNIHQSVLHTLGLLACEPPATNKSKLDIFLHFYNQGYYITLATKYGADYLLYTGDPVAFHSSYIVLVTDTSSISCLDLITAGRLARNVKKTCFLTSWSEEKVSVYSLDWMGY